jgi:hypothetical protein
MVRGYPRLNCFSRNATETNRCQPNHSCAPAAPAARPHSEAASALQIFGGRRVDVPRGLRPATSVPTAGTSRPAASLGTAAMGAARLSAAVRAAVAAESAGRFAATSVAAAVSPAAADAEGPRAQVLACPAQGTDRAHRVWRPHRHHCRCDHVEQGVNGGLDRGGQLRVTVSVIRHSQLSSQYARRCYRSVVDGCAAGR